jgi:hypothetical protein
MVGPAFIDNFLDAIAVAVEDGHGAPIKRRFLGEGADGGQPRGPQGLLALRNLPWRGDGRHGLAAGVEALAALAQEVRPERLAALGRVQDGQVVLLGRRSVRGRQREDRHQGQSEDMHGPSPCAMAAQS